MSRIVLAISAIILIALGLTWQQIHRPQHQESGQAAQALSDWPTLDQDTITAITLHHGEQTIDLHKVSSVWQLHDRYGEVAANSDLINQLLRDLTVMRPQQFITSNPDRFKRFRLDNHADRITLKGKASTPLLDLLIGKAGTDLISTTVRRLGSNQIIAVNRSLAWQLGRPATSWRAPEAKKQ